MLWDEPKIFFLERRYFFSIILSEFLKNRVALQCDPKPASVDTTRIEEGKSITVKLRSPAEYLE